METMYCRLCAEPKGRERLLNLDCDQKKYNEVVSKLSFLNAIYVDITNHVSLPRTVCFICYEALKKAYDFLDKAKRAQDILCALYQTTADAKYDFSDDDRTALDEFFGDNDSFTEVKKENESPIKNNQPVASSFNIKLEPKEEDITATSIIQSAISSIQNCPTESFEQALNVQDILDVALQKGPFTSNVQIYAKEVPEVGKDTKSWKEYPWVCAFCNIEFPNVEILRSHSKVAHSKCAAFLCADCKAFGKTDDFDIFVKHVRKHRKDLRNCCQYCDETTAQLTTHIQKHFPKNHVSCPSCGEILTNEEALRQHLRDYISVKPKRKPRRKAGTPITVEDLTCHICKKIYKNPNSLRDHLKRHTSDRKRNYTCDRCGKTFFSKGTLTSHVMAHEQVRPHVCRICNKSFLFPNMLRRHVEMHSGVKPFSCEVCGRCFRLQYQLNAHKIIHTDSMPHVCQYCNKAFRFKQILKNHERQHTGAKPYNCQHCCMEFSNWSNYNKHMKRRHNLDTSKKKITAAGVFPINPETGQIVQVDVQGMEEWKSKIMIPAKRGKKKVIKEENVTS
ncbi:zinc finger protein 791-like isoform X2 [Pectinophora gossypiella]|nr:zinc finger protein 791-like isoform X2 [Pectinophora gossypiella]